MATLRPENTAEGWNKAATTYETSIFEFTASYSADAIKLVFENQTAKEAEDKWNEPIQGQLH
jgi:hypothetical protein